VVNVVKAFADIPFNNPVFGRHVRYLIDACQRHLGIPHGPKPIRMRKELCFQNWFQHELHALLHNAVSNGGDSQWTFFGFSRLVNVFPAYFLCLKMLDCALDILYHPLIRFFQIILSHGFEINAGGLTAVIALYVVNCRDNGCFC